MAITPIEAHSPAGECAFRIPSNLENLMQPLKTATSAGVNASLGFLNLTVSVHAAVGEETGNKLTTLCVHPGEKGVKPNPIKQKYVCPTCNAEDRSTFVMGRSVGEEWVIIPAEVKEAAKAEAATSKKQLTLTVHPANEVSAVLQPSGKSYYLSIKSEPKLAETYTLLSRLVSSRPDLAFMCKFTLSSATSIFQLTTAGEGTLVLRQMANAELVREHPVINWIEPSDKALALAGMIADQEVVPFIETVHGTGKTNIIAEYVEANAPSAVPAAVGAPAAGASDMTSALEAMLAAGRQAKGPLAAVKARPRRAAKVPA
jgi:non-homologous end joining protein Ku